MDGAPTIAIVFPDGSTDTLVLDKYYLNEDDRTAGVNRCNFIGHLAEETGACVGMTGCPESEDVEFTIMSSRLNGSPMFKWARDGNVERVMHPYMVRYGSEVQMCGPSNNFHLIILITFSSSSN